MDWVFLTENYMKQAILVYIVEHIHKLLLQGKTAKEMALEMNITPNQAENILKNEMQKFKCGNKFQLAGLLGFQAGRNKKYKSINDYCNE